MLLNYVLSGRVNILNLSRIELGDGNSISYLYDVNGVKFRTAYEINQVIGVTNYFGSLAYWEIGFIYMIESVSYDISVENQKQIIENVNNGVPASLGTINLQRGMFW